MTSSPPQSPLFEISELEDEYNRFSTPAAQLKAKGKKLPIPPANVPQIDPLSRKLAEEKFSREFPRSYPRGKSQEYNAQSENPMSLVPRMHVNLPQKTESGLFLPFRIGAAQATISLPSDIKQRHTGQSRPLTAPNSQENSFEVRSAEFAKRTEAKRKLDLASQLERELSKCTFRPKVSRGTKSRSPQSSALTSTSSKKQEASYTDHYRKRKSTSKANSQSPPAPRSAQPFPTSDTLRTPPPNSSYSRVGDSTLGSFSPMRGVYSPLSPATVRTGFREGCNWDSLKDRAEQTKN